jgi:hypothetical protein
MGWNAWKNPVNELLPRSLPADVPENTWPADMGRQRSKVISHPLWDQERGIF